MSLADALREVAADLRSDARVSRSNGDQRSMSRDDILEAIADAFVDVAERVRS